MRQAPGRMRLEGRWAATGIWRGCPARPLFGSARTDASSATPQQREVSMSQLLRFAHRTRPRRRCARAFILWVLLALVPAASASAQRWRDTTDAGPVERALFRLELD